MKSRKPRGYWIKERCHQASLSCKSVKEFKSKFSGAHYRAAKEGWLGDICSHLPDYRTIKPHNYWTKEKCHQEALKYNHRKEFQIGSCTAYMTAQKKRFLDEICSHMIPAVSFMKRFIYAYEFADKCVYVGLSYNVKKRNIQHLNKKTSPVYKHLLKCEDYKLIYIINEPIDITEASSLETSTAMKYQNDGWTLLNKVSQLGNLGSSEKSRKWTKEKCLEIALKYEYRIDWHKENANSYQAALRYGWLKECTEHMKRHQREKGYWTKEKCHKEALKYKSRYSFTKGSPGAWMSATRRGFLDEICSHMETTIRISSDYWTFEKCEALAKFCTGRKDFYDKYIKAYKASIKFGFLDTLFPHKDNYIPTSYWTKENCHKEALKHNTRFDFKKSKRVAYTICLKNKWIDDVCSHMNTKKTAPRGFWDIKENCYKESIKYSSKSEFKKNCMGAYNAAVKRNWLYEFFPNTIRNKKEIFLN
jgi:predicted GIY-YIG superfamily endonuclease